MGCGWIVWSGLDDGGRSGELAPLPLLQLLQLLSYIQKMEEYVIILDFGRSKLCDKTEEWQQQEEEEELHDLLKGWPAAEEAEEGCQDEKGGHTDSSNDSDSPRRRPGRQDYGVPPFCPPPPKDGASISHGVLPHVEV